MARLEAQIANRQGRRGRSRQVRRFRRSFLIVCEGEVTEVLYFKGFPVPTEVQVSVEGEGKNTTSLVAAALHCADRGEFDEVWVVYDHDDFPAEKFNQAAKDIQELNKERRENWHAAWSHQAFEVWYLLHFQFFDARLHRHLVQEKVSELFQRHFGKKYCKNTPDVYDLLCSRQETALRHARKLAELHAIDSDVPPDNANPCTLVYRLVEALNSEIR